MGKPLTELAEKELVSPIFSAATYGRRIAWLIGITLLTAGISWLHLVVPGNPRIGFLYVLPILAIAQLFSRIVVVVFCIAFTLASGSFHGVVWRYEVISHNTLLLIVLLVVGLVTVQAERIRRRESKRIAELSAQLSARSHQNLQFERAILTSVAGVVFADQAGKIVFANESAHKLLGAESKSLAGRQLGTFFPPMAGVLGIPRETSSFRSAVECRAWRADGQVFLSHLIFSTFPTDTGPELAVIFNDAQTWFEEGDVQARLSPKLVSAVVDAHEIRNLCWAAASIAGALAKDPYLEHDERFQVLQNSIDALSKVCNFEVRPTSTPASQLNCDLEVVLSRFSALIENPLARAGVELEMPPAHFLVKANEDELLKVFLNLARNSLTALASAEIRIRKIFVRFVPGADRVLILFSDTGGGVSGPESLFEISRKGPDFLSIGLYASRAMMRTAGGDLRYEKHNGQWCFVVDVLAAHSEAISDLEVSTNDSDLYN